MKPQWNVAFAFCSFSRSCFCSTLLIAKKLPGKHSFYGLLSSECKMKSNKNELNWRTELRFANFCSLRLVWNPVCGQRLYIIKNLVREMFCSVVCFQFECIQWVSRHCSCVCVFKMVFCFFFVMKMRRIGAYFCALITLLKQESPSDCFGSQT